MINTNNIKNEIAGFIKNQSESPQEDQNKAIDDFATKLAQVITEAIKSADLTIPPGMIQVVGSPSAQANVNPIRIIKPLS